MGKAQAILKNEYLDDRSEPNAVFDPAWAAEAAAVLARLFGDEEPLDEVVASEAIHLLGDIHPTAFSAYYGLPELFARDWNRQRDLFALPGAPLPMEESVYKAWVSDPSHPLYGVKGFTRGESTAHMEEVLRGFGVNPDALGSRSADHLAVLLEFLAMLLEQRPIEEARRFCTDHLDWLSDLRNAAAALGAEELALAAVDAAECLVSAVVSS